jgi:hypothetical protein
MHILSCVDLPTTRGRDLWNYWIGLRDIAISNDYFTRIWFRDEFSWCEFLVCVADADE